MRTGLILTCLLLLSGCSDPGEGSDSTQPGEDDDLPPSPPLNDTEPAPDVRAPESEMIVLEFGPAPLDNAATFEVPEGTTVLSWMAVLNATDSGPYAALPASNGGPSFAARQPDKEAGASPDFDQAFEPVASNSAAGGQVQGPFEGEVTAPVAGEWTVYLYGAGQNLQVDLTVSYSFAPEPALVS